MKNISNNSLFSFSVPKKFGDKGFNLYEAYTCLQLCQLSYLSVTKQKTTLKQNKFIKFKGFSSENTYAFASVKDKTMYIVFRGSDLSDFDDIFDNLDIEKTEEGIGKVHAGYKKHLDRIWKNICLYISKNKCEKIIITGHSMGGAVGQIASYRLPGTVGYFFGSARSVDNKIYKSQKSHIYQIQNKYDVVTNFPPKFLFGFRLMGEKYVLKYGELYFRQQKLSEVFYSIGYMMLFLMVKLLSKIFRFNDKMCNILVKNHIVSSYHKNFEAYAVEEIFSMLGHEKMLKTNIK